MKLTTITIPAIEMTRAEEREYWRTYGESGPVVEGKRIEDWNTDDGNNCLLLEGETVYRAVVITDR